MVTFSNLTKIFPDGTEALNEVSFEVEKGLFTVILGPSGAGKTTLLRVINGLVKPSYGDVSVDGIRVIDENYRKIRTLVGMVFQHFNLVGNLSVIKNVLSGSLGTHQKWWSNLFLFPKSYQIKALDLLDRVGLLDKAYNRADELSGGEQQRVGIARAMMQEPKVLLADEPVASVDPTNSRNILSLLRDMCKEKNVTVLCSLHQVDLALQFSDRIVGFVDGKLIFNNNTSSLDRNSLRKIYDETSVEGMFFGSDMKTPDIKHIQWKE